MADVNKTLGTGQDYATAALAEAAIPANSADRYIFTGMVNENYGAAISWNVANSYEMQHTVTVDASIRHDFKPGAGGRMGQIHVITTNDLLFEYLGFDASGAFYIFTLNAGHNGFTCKECYFVFTGNSTANQIQITSNATDKQTVLEGCCFQTDSATNTNCVVLGYTTNGALISNCSFLQTAASPSGAGILLNVGNSGTLSTIVNTKALGPAIEGSFFKAFDGTSHTGSEYNVGSDTTAPGTNTTDNEAAADHYVNATSSADMDINASLSRSLFKGNDDLLGTFDAAGTERAPSGQVDIGAAQGAAAPPSGGQPAQQRPSMWVGMGMGV